MKVIIYVLCYDSNSEKLARERFGNITWMKILFVPTTFYSDSFVFSESLSDLENDWMSADYVGTISYNCVDKGVNLYNIRKAFSQAMDSNELPDVIAFYGEKSTNMIKITNLVHPNFDTIWNELTTKLETVGYNKTIPNDKIKGFFCNYWVAKPEWMSRYISFFKKARVFIDYNKSIRSEIWKDSTYPLVNITEDDLMRIYGKPYYPYLPFVCERLPCYFFENENATILFNSIIEWKIENNVIDIVTNGSNNFETIDFTEINWPQL